MKESRVPLCEIFDADELGRCVPVGFTPELRSRVQNLASLYLRWVPSAREIRQVVAQTRNLGVRLTAIWPSNFSRFWADYGPTHTTVLSRPVMSSRHVAFSVEVVQCKGMITFVPAVIVSLVDHQQAIVREPGKTGWPQLYWLVRPVDVLALLQTIGTGWKELEIRAPAELRHNTAIEYTDCEAIPHWRCHWTNGNFDDFDGVE